MTAAPRTRVEATAIDQGTARINRVDESEADLHIRDVRVARATRIAVLGPLRIGGVHPRITPRDRVVLEALSIRVGDNVTTDFYALVASWAEWAEAEVANWPDDIASHRISDERTRQVLDRARWSQRPR